jgi:sterol desaturase/sphingolipid hydroxylase (fatty acid hydroxylase superfamily)
MDEQAMTTFAHQWIVGFAAFVLSAAACTVFELLAAAEQQTWTSRIRATLFWSLFLAATSAIVLSAQALIHHVGMSPLVSLDLRSSIETQNPLALVAVYVLLPFAPSLLFDCLYYWFHRLQHVVPILWRFHAVHHSIEELNAANCYHHATEALFRLPFILLPLMLLVELRVPDVFIVSAGIAAWGQFVHANTRISFGPLDYALASPRFHRVHHSLAKEHHDKNFASFFPLLDVLFGTAYFPRSDEVIRTGLSDRREPRTIGQYLLALAPRDVADRERGSTTSTPDLMGQPPPIHYLGSRVDVLRRGK